MKEMYDLSLLLLQYINTYYYNIFIITWYCQLLTEKFHTTRKYWFCFLAANTYGLSPRNPAGCNSCDCDPTGTLNGEKLPLDQLPCNQNNGTCTCLSNRIGRRCDSCEATFYLSTEPGDVLISSLLFFVILTFILLGGVTCSHQRLKWRNFKDVDCLC